MSGARSYTVGTERALAVLAAGTCYAPGCRTPAIEWVEGLPVWNLEIAHIHGAHPGAARYVPSMSDDERASFPNLLLLCTAHHQLVDRLRREDYPAELLSAWKSDREASGLESLRRLRALTEARLIELIESAARAVGPVREIVLDLDGGVLMPAGGVLATPLDGWREVLSVNRQGLTGTPVLVAVARNIGSLRASVEQVSVYVGIEDAGATYPLTLLGRNDFPGLNPSLPAGIEVGDTVTWLTSLDTVRMLRRQAAEASHDLGDLWASVALGTGERIESTRSAIASLPL